MSIRSISIHRPLAVAAMLILLAAAPAAAQPSGSGGPAGGPVAGGGQDGAGDGSGGGAPRVSRDGREGSLAGGAMSAAEFGAWLDSSREAVRYAAVRPRIRETAAAAIAAGVPAEAFISRIKEAAAKGIPPDTLAAALEADAARWITVAALLRGRDWPPGEERADFYLAAGSSLLNGVGMPALAALVDWAVGAKAAAGRTGAILGTVASMGNAFRWTPETGARLALALAASRLKPGDFPALAELAGRAAAGGVSAQAFMEAAEAVFGAKGGIAELKKRLFP